jgi:hypothetical protein
MVAVDRRWRLLAGAVQKKAFATACAAAKAFWSLV